MKPSLILTLSPYLSGYPLVSVYRSGLDYEHKEVWSHDAPDQEPTLRFRGGPHKPGAMGWETDEEEVEDLLSFIASYAEYDYAPDSGDLGERPLPDLDGEDDGQARVWWRQHGEALLLEVDGGEE